MNLTETEAKTRACCKPSGKMIVDNGPCIASECMAWRWKTVSKLVTDEESGEQTWEYHRDHIGCCGFAGIPPTVTHIDGKPVNAVLAKAQPE